MRTQIHKLAVASILSLAGAACVAQQGASLNPAQTEAFQRMAAHEADIKKQLEERTPIVEVYIQGTKPDPQLIAVPNGDEYFITRATLAEGKEKKTRDLFYKDKLGKTLIFDTRTSLSKIDHLLGVKDGEEGYLSMILPSLNGALDLKQSKVTYLGHQFLGQIKTDVFFVAPRGKGDFVGKVWEDEQDGVAVRFNGEFPAHPNFHFDSWRLNVAPGVWVPSSIYLEDTSPLGIDHRHFHALSHIWGYSLSVPELTGDTASVKIDDVTDDSDQTGDLSPLQAKREFEKQSENNITTRLYQAGLLAGPSDFDKVCEQVITNLIIGSNLPLNDVHCRVLLTTPLESFTAGNTIVLSKGLIDTLPNEESLAMAISFQLAHLALGHVVSSRYSFSDSTFFADPDAYQHVPMSHSETDNTAAAAKAIEILQASVYKDKLANAALYLNELQVRSAPLAMLMHPRIGDGFFTNDSLKDLWLQRLEATSPAINMNDLHQVPALPLNSQLKIDPWNDSVDQLALKANIYRSAADKIPFEITPVYYRLARVTPTAAATTGSAANGK